MAAVLGPRDAVLADADPPRGASPEPRGSARSEQVREPARVRGAVRAAGGGVGPAAGGRPR